MSAEVIILFLSNLVFNSRILDTLSWYILMLMLPMDKHSQVNAEKISGKDNSLFSNLLKKDPSFSKHLLNRLNRKRLQRIAPKRRPLIPDVPWTVAILVDATLHKRSSSHAENVQKFTHGKGWVIGHQWTNIVILINEEMIPLPPIVFYTKEECARRNIPYQTEHEKVANFLSTFSLDSLTETIIDPKEIVVILDSGYDSKIIQNTILSRKWDFLSSIKSSRTVDFADRSGIWSNISNFFKDGRRPWKTIRIASYCGKKKRFSSYQFKEKLGYLKDIRLRVKLICSKRSSDKRIKFLATSNVQITPKQAITVYKHRWKIEIFHRDTKSFLGLEDAGVRCFNSLHSHVHLVYVAYGVLREKYQGMSIKSAQLAFERECRVKEVRKMNQALTQVDGAEKVKQLNRSVIREIEMLKAA
jgi:hypothetical protein